jgi:hypothetical protein
VEAAAADLAVWRARDADLTRSVKSVAPDRANALYRVLEGGARWSSPSSPKAPLRGHQHYSLCYGGVGAWFIIAPHRRRAAASLVSHPSKSGRDAMLSQQWPNIPRPQPVPCPPASSTLLFLAGGGGGGGGGGGEGWCVGGGERVEVRVTLGPFIESAASTGDGRRRASRSPNSSSHGSPMHRRLRPGGPARDGEARAAPPRVAASDRRRRATASSLDSGRRRGLQMPSSMMRRPRETSGIDRRDDLFL